RLVNTAATRDEIAPGGLLAGRCWRCARSYPFEAAARLRRDARAGHLGVAARSNRGHLPRFGLRRGRMFVDLMQSALGRWLSALRRRHVGDTGDHRSANACLSVCRELLPSPGSLLTAF